MSACNCDCATHPEGGCSCGCDCGDVEALRAALASERTARAEAERRVAALTEEVMAPCDCPAHVERRRAEAAERERDALRATEGAAIRLMADERDEALAALSALRDEAGRLRRALLVYFPPGSWCGACGQGIHAPDATPCRDPVRGCVAARAALSVDDGGAPASAPGRNT
jgi:hypothetical protein